MQQLDAQLLGFVSSSIGLIFFFLSVKIFHSIRTEMPVILVITLYRSMYILHHMFKGQREDEWIEAMQKEDEGSAGVGETQCTEVRVTSYQTMALSL